MKRWTTLIGFVLCALGFAVGPASAQGQEVYFHGCGGNGDQIEPAEIVLTCADAKLRVEALKWSTWESVGARATGTLTYPDCPPKVPLVQCRSYAHDPVTFELSQAEYCPRYESWVFTQALVIDESAPTPATRNSPFRFPCLEQRPPKFFLGTNYASSLMLNALGRRPAFAFSAAGGRKVRCNHRVAQDRVKCRMSWYVGDLVFWGRGMIWITYPQHKPYWNFSYRIVRFNEYCAVVGGADCTKVYVKR
ncbi:MAG: hypothetical protein WAT66_07260 [Actinomycetota bacterium]